MFDKIISPLLTTRRSLSGELLEEMKAHVKAVSLRKNEVLTAAGSLQRHAYLIGKGSLTKFFITDEGNRLPVWFYFDEVFDIALCPDSYFMNRPTKYELIANENSVVLKFDKYKVDAWLRKYPKFRDFYHNDVVAASVAAEEMRAYQLAHSPLEFLAYIDRKYPVFKKRISGKNMARFIGVSPEWYCKLKKRCTN